MKITKRQLRRIIKEEKRKLLRESADPMVDEIANQVQMMIDHGTTAIMDFEYRLQDAGYNAEYLSGAGMRMVQIPHGNVNIVIISKNAVEPDGDTVIVGPYAIGVMG